MSYNEGLTRRFYELSGPAVPIAHYGVSPHNIKGRANPDFSPGIISDPPGTVYPDVADFWESERYIYFATLHRQKYDHEYADPQADKEALLYEGPHTITRFDKATGELRVFDITRYIQSMGKQWFPPNTMYAGRIKQHPLGAGMLTEDSLILYRFGEQEHPLGLAGYYIDFTKVRAMYIRQHTTKFIEYDINLPPPWTRMQWRGAIPREEGQFPRIELSGQFFRIGDRLGVHIVQYVRDTYTGNVDGTGRVLEYEFHYDVHLSAISGFHQVRLSHSHYRDSRDTLSTFQDTFMTTPGEHITHTAFPYVLRHVQIVKSDDTVAAERVEVYDPRLNRAVTTVEAPPGPERKRDGILSSYRHVRIARMDDSFTQFPHSAAMQNLKGKFGARFFIDGRGYIAIVDHRGRVEVASGTPGNPYGLNSDVTIELIDNNNNIYTSSSRSFSKYNKHGENIFFVDNAPGGGYGTDPHMSSRSKFIRGQQEVVRMLKRFTTKHRTGSGEIVDYLSYWPNDISLATQRRDLWPIAVFSVRNRPRLLLGTLDRDSESYYWLNIRTTPKRRVTIKLRDTLGRPVNAGDVNITVYQDGRLLPVPAQSSFEVVYDVERRSSLEISASHALYLDVNRTIGLHRDTPSVVEVVFSIRPPDLVTVEPTAAAIRMNRGMFTFWGVKGWFRESSNALRIKSYGKVRVRAHWYGYPSTIIEDISDRVTLVTKSKQLRIHGTVLGSADPGFYVVSATYAGTTGEMFVEFFGPDRLQIDVLNHLNINVMKNREPTIRSGAECFIRVQAKYRDGFSEFCTDEVKWTTSNNIKIEGNKLTALAPGPAHITAEYKGAFESVSLYVAEVERPQITQTNTQTSTAYVFFQLPGNLQDVTFFKLGIYADQARTQLIEEVSIFENPERFKVSTDRGRTWNTLTSEGYVPQGEEVYRAEVPLGPVKNVWATVSAALAPIGWYDETDFIPPVISISAPSGPLRAGETVTITTDEEADIYYTLNGDIPTLESTRYTGPITITEDTVLRCIAVDKKGNVSNVAAAVYTVDLEPPKVEVHPTPGTIVEPTHIVLSVDERADIFYTLDGSEPTFSSQRYTAPILIEETTELRVLAVDDWGNQSQIYSFVYKYVEEDEDLPDPVLPPAPGTTVETAFEWLFGEVMVDEFTEEDNSFYYRLKGLESGELYYISFPEDVLVYVLSAEGGDFLAVSSGTGIVRFVATGEEVIVNVRQSFGREDLTYFLEAAEFVELPADRIELRNTLEEAQLFFSSVSRGDEYLQVPAAFYDALAHAINSASDALFSEDIEPEDLERALVELQDALSAAQAAQVKINRAMLRERIDEAEFLLATTEIGSGGGMVPQDIYDLLAAALEDARTVVNSAQEQYEIDEATIAITNAIAIFRQNRRQEEIDFSGLLTAISEAENLIWSHLPGVGLWQIPVNLVWDIEDAVESSRALMLREFLAQREVDEATEELQNLLRRAFDSIKTKDGYALEVKIAEARNLLASYAPGSGYGQIPVEVYQSLEDKAREAEDLLQNPEAIQSQYDQMVLELQQEIDRFLASVIPYPDPGENKENAITIVGGVASGAVPRTGSLYFVARGLWVGRNYEMQLEPESQFQVLTADDEVIAQGVGSIEFEVPQSVIYFYVTPPEGTQTVMLRLKLADSDQPITEGVDIMLLTNLVAGREYSLIADPGTEIVMRLLDDGGNPVKESSGDPPTLTFIASGTTANVIFESSISMAGATETSLRIRVREIFDLSPDGKGGYDVLELRDLKEGGQYRVEAISGVVGVLALVDKNGNEVAYNDDYPQKLEFVGSPDLDKIIFRTKVNPDINEKVRIAFEQIIDGRTPQTAYTLTVPSKIDVDHADLAYLWRQFDLAPGLEGKRVQVGVEPFDSSFAPRIIFVDEHGTGLTQNMAQSLTFDLHPHLQAKRLYVDHGASFEQLLFYQNLRYYSREQLEVPYTVSAVDYGAATTPQGGTEGDALNLQIGTNTFTPISFTSTTYGGVRVTPDTEYQLTFSGLGDQDTIHVYDSSLKFGLFGPFGSNMKKGSFNYAQADPSGELTISIVARSSRLIIEYIKHYQSTGDPFEVTITEVGPAPQNDGLTPATARAIFLPTDELLVQEMADYGFDRISDFVVVPEGQQEAYFTIDLAAAMFIENARVLVHAGSAPGTLSYVDKPLILIEESSYNSSKVYQLAEPSDPDAPLVLKYTLDDDKGGPVGIGFYLYSY